MRVAVLGAGYAGLTLARKLERTLPDDVHLVVIDESDKHVLQHELHRLIRRPSFVDEITVPLEDVLDCEIRQAKVTKVSPEQNLAILDTDERLEYDIGAICLGAETNDYGISGIESYATPLTRIEHAKEIRAAYLDVLESDGRVVVGGAGLSGVQVVGELAAMAREAGGNEASSEEGADEDRSRNDDQDSHKDQRPSEARDRHQDHDRDEDRAHDANPEIVLLEQFGAVAPSFPEPFQRTIHDQLVELGIEIRTNTAVESVDSKKLSLSPDAELAYDQFVWTGGIRGPDALGSERPVVRSDLRVADDTFVVGDAGRVVDVDGTSVPASAQAAIREASVAARNIVSIASYRLDDSPGFTPELDRYEFDSPGWLVSVGDGAVAQVGSRVLTGRPAKALKTTVGAGYLGSVGAFENAVDFVRDPAP